MKVPVEHIKLLLQQTCLICDSAQVAKLMVKGMEEGRYVLRFPDVMSTCICAALGGTSELAMPAALAAFIAPFVVGALSDAPWLHAWEILCCSWGAL